MQVEQTVFIVDDDASVRQSISAIVTSNGVKARAYESAEQFLDSGDYRSPGCVVTDIRMAGMTGFQLHAQLQHQGIDIPMIVITGFADLLADHGLADCHGIKLLEKTCSSEELWDAIREALGMS